MHGGDWSLECRGDTCSIEDRHGDLRESPIQCPQHRRIVQHCGGAVGGIPELSVAEESPEGKNSNTMTSEASG